MLAIIPTVESGLQENGCKEESVCRFTIFIGKPQCEQDGAGEIQARDV